MPCGKLNFQDYEIDPFAFIIDFQTRLFSNYANLVVNSEIGRSVIMKLKEDQRVIALDGKIISRGSGSQSFDINILAMWFLWCANEYGEENAETHLNSFLNSAEILVLNTLWILGVKIDQPITLSDGYKIQPIDQMPDSKDKEYFLKFRFNLIGEERSTPVSAITKYCRVPKIEPENPSTLPDGHQEIIRSSQRLNNIALLLNTISGVSCIPYYSSTYVDPTTPFGLFGGSGGGYYVYDVQTSGSTKLSCDSITLVEILLTKYEKLSDSERTRFQRILSRLSQAKRHTQIEDKILDLGIALEMLLLDENPNNQQLALAFRLHGSWLLGKSAEDRIEKYNLLNDIYAYRSQVAHSGRLCKGNVAQIKVVQQSFSQYQSLAEEICQKLIIDGKPNWKELVLGAI